MMRAVVRAVLGAVVVLLATLGVVSGLLAFLPGGGESWLHRALANAATVFELNSTISQSYHVPVLETIARASARSVILILGTAVLLLLSGGLLGLLAAFRPAGPVVSSINRTFAGISTLPVLFWATLVFLVGAAGYGIVLADSVQNTLAQAAPVLVAASFSLLLGDRLLADVARQVQLAASTALAEPYMRSVRAGGLGVPRHVIQSMVPPVAEFLAARIMVLISATIVAESIFEIRGLGYLVRDALQRGAERDVPLVLGASVALVAIGLVARVVCNALVALADPRTRQSVAGAMP